MMHTNSFLARGYSKALFGLCEACGAQEPMLIWLETLSSWIQDPSLKYVVTNNLVPVKVKQSILLSCSDLLATKCSPTQQQVDRIPAELKTNFIKLLANQNNLLLLPDIFYHYDRLFLANSNKLRLTIVSAIELIPHQQQQLIKQLQKKFGRQLIVTFEIDQKIIAGIQIKYLDNTIDYSLQNSLSQLKPLLMN